MASKNNIRNANRIIQLTRSSVFREGNDPNDWRHTIQFIYTKDKDAAEVKPDNYYAFNDQGMAAPFDNTVVSDEVDLLLDGEAGISTTNTFESISSSIDGGITSFKKKADTILNVLPPKAQLIGKVMNQVSNLINVGAEVATDIYDIFKAFSAAADGESTGMSFSPWYENLLGWAGSGAGIGFTYDFKFSMGQYGLWNAEEEVFKPVLNLLATALPRHMSSVGIAGPFPSSLVLINRGIKAMGKNLIESQGTYKDPVSTSLVPAAAAASGGNTLNQPSEILPPSSAAVSGGIGLVADPAALDSLSYVLSETVGPFTFNIKFGNFFEFRHVIIRDVVTSFSPELDQYGFPVEGHVQVTFETAMPAVLSSTGQDAMGVRFGKMTRR